MGEATRFHEKTPWRDESLLRKVYVGQGLSCRDIADLWETTPRTISRWLNRHGIEPDKDSKYASEGGGFATANTYEYILTPAGEQRVLVHRLAAVAEYGLDSVVQADLVHHRDGVPWNNSRDNLMLMSQSDHTEHHRKEQ